MIHDAIPSEIKHNAYAMDLRSFIEPDHASKQGRPATGLPLGPLKLDLCLGVIGMLLPAVIRFVT